MASHSASYQSDPTPRASSSPGPKHSSLHGDGADDEPTHPLLFGISPGDLLLVSRQAPSQEDGAAYQPSHGAPSHFDQSRSNRTPPVQMPCPVPTYESTRLLLINPAQFADILAVCQQLSTPTSARDASLPNVPGPPVRNVHHAAAAAAAADIDLLSNTHTRTVQPDMPRTPQPPNIPQEQAILREDIEPSSPTESMDGRPNHWDPLRYYG